jgi:hypothetical protein
VSSGMAGSEHLRGLRRGASEMNPIIISRRLKSLWTRRPPLPFPFALTAEIEMTQKAAYLLTLPVYNHICDDTSRQRGIGFACNVLASRDLNADVGREYPLVKAKQTFQDPSISSRETCHRHCHRVIV